MVSAANLWRAERTEHPSYNRNRYASERHRAAIREQQVPFEQQRWRGDLVQYEGKPTDEEGMAAGISGVCETCGSMICKTEPCCHISYIAWPPDALTRLLMDADGIQESALDALLKRVARTRGIHQSAVTDHSGHEIDGP